MDELIHNKTKNENSRIFSTTENKNSIPNAEADIQFWTCRKCGACEREEQSMFCIHCIDIEDPLEAIERLEKECEDMKHASGCPCDKCKIKEQDRIINGLVDKISELTAELQAIEIDFEDYKKESRDEVANALWEQMKGRDL